VAQNGVNTIGQVWPFELFAIDSLTKTNETTATVVVVVVKQRQKFFEQQYQARIGYNSTLWI
jgi:hypothetical protein